MWIDDLDYLSDLDIAAAYGYLAQENANVSKTEYGYSLDWPHGVMHMDSNCFDAAIMAAALFIFFWKEKHINASMAMELAVHASNSMFT